MPDDLTVRWAHPGDDLTPRLGGAAARRWNPAPTLVAAAAGARVGVLLLWDGGHAVVLADQLTAPAAGPAAPHAGPHRGGGPGGGRALHPAARLAGGAPGSLPGGQAAAGLCVPPGWPAAVGLAQALRGGPRSWPRAPAGVGAAAAAGGRRLAPTPHPQRYRLCGLRSPLGRAEKRTPPGGSRRCGGRGGRCG
jgi:hypothetical protein